MDEQEKAYLEAAAKEVYRQMEENPGLAIPVDPEVAEYMGAFTDDAMDLTDAIEGAEPMPEED
ncbi:MAG TPA: hypothetical protein DEB25_04760 [Desulfobulbaceae bacterium]|nr:hypothetical protein [Desulfobulbaceae bacterium]